MITIIRGLTTDTVENLFDYEFSDKADKFTYTLLIIYFVYRRKLKRESKKTRSERERVAEKM